MRIEIEVKDRPEGDNKYVFWGDFNLKTSDYLLTVIDNNDDEEHDFLCSNIINISVQLSNFLILKS